MIDLTQWMHLSTFSWPLLPCWSLAKYMRAEACCRHIGLIFQHWLSLTQREVRTRWTTLVPNGTGITSLWLPPPLWKSVEGLCLGSWGLGELIFCGADVVRRPVHLIPLGSQYHCQLNFNNVKKKKSFSLYPKRNISVYLWVKFFNLNFFAMKRVGVSDRAVMWK